MTNEDAKRADKIAHYILAHEGVRCYLLNDAVFDGDKNIDPRSIMAQVERELRIKVFGQDTEGRMNLMQTGRDILANGGFEGYFKGSKKNRISSVIINGNNNGSVTNVGDNTYFESLTNRPIIMPTKTEKTIFQKTISWIASIIGALITGYLIYRFGWNK